MNPTLENLDSTDWIAGAAAIVLLVSLFLPWVRVSRNVGNGSFVEAWGASFGWINLVVVAAVAVEFVSAVLDFDLRVPGGLVYLFAGALGFIMTVVMMVLRPTGMLEEGVALFAVSKMPWIGAFISLAASIVIACCGYFRFREEMY